MKNKKGFTLGETIIIVVIIIVLALILIWGVWTFIKSLNADVDLSGSPDLCTGIVLNQP